MDKASVKGRCKKHAELHKAADSLQLNHDGKTTVRSILRRKGLPLDSPQIAASILEIGDPAGYQALLVAEGQDIGNWVTFPPRYSIEIVGRWLREYELRDKEYMLAVCYVFGLEPTSAIAQPASLEFFLKLYAAMKFELFQISNSMQAGPTFVLSPQHQLVLGFDCELTAPVKVNANTILLQRSNDRLSNPDCKDIVQLAVLTDIPQKQLPLGYVFIQSQTGVVSMALDNRPAAWGVVDSDEKKAIDIVQVKRGGLHQSVLAQLFGFLAAEKLPFSSLSANLYGIDWFNFRAAYRLSKATDPEQKAQDALQESAFYKALTKLGLSLEVHVTHNSQGLPASACIKAEPQSAHLSVAALAVAA